MAYKRIVIFDLDMTAIDSSHRTPNHPDGTLDLEKYLQLKNRENTLQDSLLPLAQVWKGLDLKENYVVVCTARTWAEFDQEFLTLHGLKYHKLIARFTKKDNTLRDAELKKMRLGKLFNLKQFKALPKFMFDDAIPVIKELRRSGYTVLNSIKINRKLSKV